MPLSISLLSLDSNAIMYFSNSFTNNMLRLEEDVILLFHLALLTGSSLHRWCMLLRDHHKTLTLGVSKTTLGFDDLLGRLNKHSRQSCSQLWFITRIQRKPLKDVAYRKKSRRIRRHKHPSVTQDMQTSSRIELWTPLWKLVKQGSSLETQCPRILLEPNHV